MTTQIKAQSTKQSKSNAQQSTTKPSTQEDIILATYRFKLSNEISEELKYFTTLHKYDDRKTFKESWTKWINEPNIAELIHTEKSRMTNEGYYAGDKNIIDKMFKSARYYYKKKGEQHANDQEKQPEESSPHKTREYIKLSRTILKIMDEHITQKIKENTIKKSNNTYVSEILPHVAYDDFCELHKDVLTEEIQKLVSNKSEIELTPTKISNKFKKTYKNRYFITRMSLTNNSS